MPATILAFAPRRPEGEEPGEGAARPRDRLLQAPLSAVVSMNPPSPRQVAHRWAMLAHLRRREEPGPPGTVR